MLYLIRVYGPGRNQSILKIGFTDDPKKREYQYFSHDPFSQFISVREGDLVLEGLIHRYLRSLGLQYERAGKSLDEWFENKPEVLTVFHLSREAIEKLVWRNRDKIFDMKSPSPFDYSLFEALYKKNINKFEGSQYKVVEGKVYKTKAKDVDIDFWNLHIKKENASYPSENNPDVRKFLSVYLSTGNFQKKMEAFCEFMDNCKDQPKVSNSVLGRIEPKFNNFYSLFGTEGCKALNYRELDLTQKLEYYSKSSVLRAKVLEVFNIGEKYLKKTIKEMLVKIYDDLELLGKNAKATDLLEWFEVREYQATVDHKRVSGYEILSIKKTKNN